MTKPPPHFRTQDLVCIALFAVLISVSAWIAIPLSAQSHQSEKDRKRLKCERNGQRDGDPC